MASNRLQLNADKPKVLRCATRQRRHQLPTTAVSIGGATVVPASHVRDLGIYVDADLGMRTHVLKANGVRLFCRSPTTASDPPLCISDHFQFAGSGSSADLSHLTGLWEWCVGRPSGLLITSAPVLLNAAARLNFDLRPSDHVRDALSQSSMAACTRANAVQDRRADMQSPSWECAMLSGNTRSRH